MSAFLDLEADRGEEFDPRVDRADQAQGVLFPGSPDEPRVTMVAPQVDTVVALVSLGNYDQEGMSEELRQITEMLAEKIDTLSRSWTERSGVIVAIYL